jgi:hypothetical protein
MKTLIPYLALATAVLLWAQTPSDYLTIRCGSGTVGTPYLLWTGKVSYPTCLAIGASLKVTAVNGHDTLDAIALPAARTWGQLTQAADGTYLTPNANALVFRNGVFQTPVLDYSVNASTLTPAMGAPWAADDVITAVF